MGRPETKRPIVREFLEQRRGQAFTVPEICHALGMDPYLDHATVGRALRAIGAEQIGRHTPRSRPGRGGSRKPVKLWLLPPH